MSRLQSWLSLLAVCGLSAVGAALGSGCNLPLPGFSAMPWPLDFGNQILNTTSAPTTLTFTNLGVGTADLSINALKLTGANAGDFAQVAGGSCGSLIIILRAGQSCTVQFTFKPSTTTSESATLIVADNTSSSPHSISFTGTGIASLPASSFVVTPNPLAFGNQVQNTTSAPMQLTLSQVGLFVQPSITVTALTLTGANAADFALAAGSTCGSVPFNVPGGGATGCFLFYTFKPSTTSSESAILSITDDVAGSPQSVSFTGTGTGAPAPVFGAAPSPLAFGNQVQNTTSAPMTLTFSNSGTAALSITALALTGANAGDFAQAAGGSCSSLPISISAGGNCTAQFTFKPSTTTSESATLNVTDNAAGSPQSVSFTGTGTAPPAPVFGAAPSPLAFGNQVQNTTSAPMTLTFSNSGTAALNISGLSVTGANAGDFAQVAGGSCSSLPISISAGGSCTVQFTFKPSTTTSESATLSVTDNAAGSPHSVSFTGTGIASVPTLGAILAPGSISAVDFAGDTLVTTTASLFGAGAGTASVFVKDSVTGNWSQKTTLTNPDSSAASVAISRDGGTIVVGACNFMTHSPCKGHGFVYTIPPTGGWAAWNVTNFPPTMLSVSNALPNGGDNIGLSIATDQHGDTVAMGVPCDSSTGNIQCGSVDVYLKGSGWLSPRNEDANLTFLVSGTNLQTPTLGISVAMDDAGDTIVAGASGVQTGVTVPGAAYIFLKPAAGWANVMAPNATLTAKNGAIGDGLGFSVAMSADGGTVVAGAPFAPSGAGQGAAYVFVEPANGWQPSPPLNQPVNETTKLTASDGKNGDLFGHSVTLSSDGGSVAIGAPNHVPANSASTGIGQVYLYARPLGGWGSVTPPTQTILNAAGGTDSLGNMVTPAFSFGSNVALSGDASTLAISGQVKFGTNQSESVIYVF